MSFKPNFYIVPLVFALALAISCEDTKKPSQNASMGETVIDSAKTDSPNENAAKLKKIEFPKLTSENAVSFLTEYGEENPETQVRIGTRFGAIELELFEDTPLHRANFIYLVKRGYFDETFFSRVVPNFIIQGGNSDNFSTARKRTAIGNTYELPAEIIPSRNHAYGTVSGAKEYRENPDKKTHPFEFFIFLGPPTATAHLDGNYTIFGRVTRGMDVVEEISELPADDGDWPLQNVYIDVSVLD